MKIAKFEQFGHKITTLAALMTGQEQGCWLRNAVGPNYVFQVSRFSYIRFLRKKTYIYDKSKILRLQEETIKREQ